MSLVLQELTVKLLRLKKFNKKNDFVPLLPHEFYRVASMENCLNLDSADESDVLINPFI